VPFSVTGAYLLALQREASPLSRSTIVAPSTHNNIGDQLGFSHHVRSITWPVISSLLGLFRRSYSESHPHAKCSSVAVASLLGKSILLLSSIKTLLLDYHHLFQQKKGIAFELCSVLDCGCSKSMCLRSEIIKDICVLNCTSIASQVYLSMLEF